MSTIKVNKIEATATSDGGIAIDSSGHVTLDGQQLPTAGALTGRRININGAMQVAQRGTVTNAGNEYGGPDRYRLAKNDGAYTISQDTDAPSGSGFASSFKIDVTSAASSTGNQFVIFQHKMEGQDLQQFKKGTSSAESFTLQFWIKSTKTGTYVVELTHSDQTRHVCKTYTVSSSNTWEYKTITFPADTSGVLANNNASSLQLNWWLYAGSTYASGTLPTSWATFADANSAVGQVNAADNTSNNILFTGIQLEVGEKATPFEHRSYGDELARCQRYFIKSGNIGTATEWFPGVATHAEHGRVMALALDGQNDRAVIIDSFPTAMRAAGSATFYPGRDQVTNTAGNITVYNGNTSVTTSGKPIPSTTGFEAYFTGTSTDARAYTLQYTVDSEL